MKVFAIFAIIALAFVALVSAYGGGGGGGGGKLFALYFLLFSNVHCSQDTEVERWAEVEADTVVVVAVEEVSLLLKLVSI